MAKDLPTIEKLIAKKLKTSVGRDAEHAFVQALNLHTLIRTGNDEQQLANEVQRDKSAANYGAILKKGETTYGLTTLQARHVVERANGIHLKFAGKMGEAVDVMVTDPEMVSGLIKRRNKCRKGTDPLFPTIDDNSLRNWRKSIDIGGGRTLNHYRIHDIRGCKVTNKAVELIEAMPRPTSVAEWNKAFEKVLAMTGPMLGHKEKNMVTATSYILPEVWVEWRDNENPVKMARILKAHGVEE